MWFKVDDRLPDHRKVRKLRRSHPDKVRDAAPLGLWVLAGAWSDDGFVPTEVLIDWDDNAAIHAERLVEAGLWIRAVEGGEQGYRFHDWGDMNPDPAAAATSGTFGNHQRWHIQRGKIAPDCRYCTPDVAPPIAPESGGDIAPDIGGESLNPTRPDPTEETRSPAAADEHEFEAWWKIYPRKVGKGQARRAYKTASKKADPDMLLGAVEVFAERARHSDPQFVPHPATWLNGERWLDAPTEDPGYRIEEDWS